MGWPLAIAALAASLAGNELNRQAQVKAARKRQQLAVEGIRRRTQKANERLKPLFKQASEDVGAKKEKEIFTSEDAKNLATINKTKSMMDNRLTGGLETGGKKSAEFQSLQSDRFTKSKAGQDKRDLAMSRFLSPSRVGQIRGQAVNDVAFGRASVADELIADRNINDMRISSTKSEGSVLGDILRIAGMAGSVYNMGAGLGAEQAANPYSEIWGASMTPAQAATSGSAGIVGSSTPWYQSAYNSVGDFFQPADSVLPVSPTSTTFASPTMGATTDMSDHWGKMGWQNNANGRMINRFGGSQSRAYP
jgi:hypothetical protein